MNRLARSTALSFVVSALALACTQAAMQGGEPTGTARADYRVIGPGRPILAPATVQLERSTVLNHVGPGFVGLGYSKGVMNQGLFAPANSALIALFKGLGSGILRLGGGGANGVDNNAWQENPEAAPASNQISQGEVNNLSAFLTDTGWQALYGVNMLTGCSDGSEDAGGVCPAVDPTVAASEAGYVASTLGGSLYGFEIGNEPEVYAQKGEGSLGSYAAFNSEWSTLYQAMKGQAPNAAFTGPATSGGFGLGSGDPITKYVTPFASDEKGNFSLLTQHYYRDVGNVPAPNTLEQLLEPDPKVVPALQALSAIATSNGVPNGYAIAEANSYSGGGVDYVSDAFGTALWALDFLFLNAQNGSSGVSFYGGGFNDGYTPIADDKQGQVCGTMGAISCYLSMDKNASPPIPEAPPVRPVYYGMKLFSMAGQGAVIGSPISWGFGERPNLTAYAIEQGLGTTSIVLINKDATRTASVTIDLGEQASSATVSLLQDAAGINDSAGPFTIDGATIAPDGSWAPQAPTAVSVVQGNQLELDVPPGTAALVTEKAVCTTPEECCAERGGIYVRGRCYFRYQGPPPVLSK